MTPLTVRVFDPPMCCSTGVCGPDPDPALAQIAADLQWAAGHGVAVERYSLAREPEVFANTPAVVAAFRRSSVAALPLVLVGDELLREGGYPTRAELADRLGLTVAPAVAGS
jgi:thiamine pyrophosphate-dependent acetolactate synthase large subunit-like protein